MLFRKGVSFLDLKHRNSWAVDSDSTPLSPNFHFS
jgi:hypothetical protein